MKFFVVCFINNDFHKLFFLIKNWLFEKILKILKLSRRQSCWFFSVWLTLIKIRALRRLKSTFHLLLHHFLSFVGFKNKIFFTFNAFWWFLFLNFCIFIWTLLVWFWRLNFSWLHFCGIFFIVVCWSPN